MSVQILCYFYNLTLIFIYYFPVSRVLKISKDWLKCATVISKKKKGGENVMNSFNPSLVYDIYDEFLNESDLRSDMHYLGSSENYPQFKYMTFIYS